MVFERNYPAEALARSTKAFRRAWWVRKTLYAVIVVSVVFAASEFIKGAFAL